MNLSVLDGWWDEAYRPECGWAIGRGEEYQDPDLQDEVEGKALYDLLEREIIPLFYTRGRDGLPREWIKRMKASMRYVGKRFNSHRMLMEYADNFYLPALKNYESFWKDDFAQARELAAYLNKLAASWPQILVESILFPDESIFQVGESIQAAALVKLGSLVPEEVLVELYYGPLASKGEIEDAERVEMSVLKTGNEIIEYGAEIKCFKTGRQGYTVRVLPKHPFLVHSFLPGFIRWG